MFPPNTKILVVDDFATMRKIVRKILTELKFSNVQEADDGATAWPMLEASAKTDQPFQLVISDWNMPKMQGLELLANTRNHPQTAHLPFIMIVPEREQQNISEAITIGVSACVLKPFNGKTLKDKLENAFKKGSATAA